MARTLHSYCWTPRAKDINEILQEINVNFDEEYISKVKEILGESLDFSKEMIVCTNPVALWWQIMNT